MLYTDAKVTLNTGKIVFCALLLAAMAGCGPSGSTSGATPAGSVSSTSPSSASANPPPAVSSAPGSPAGSATPTITGSPATKAQVGQPYSFTPTVQNTTDQPMGFSIANKPAWATFSIANGSLTGTPSSSDVGTDSNIVISVSNAQDSAALSPFNIAVAAPPTSPPPSCNGGSTSSQSGACLVFNYATGFSGASGAIQTVTDAAQLNGAVMDLTNGTVGQHEAGSDWYKTKLDITSFTTDFTFQITPSGYGITFIIQNDPRGVMASADANGIGYFAYSSNPPDTAIENSVAIAFNATPNNSGDTIETDPSLTGLYIDGGQVIDHGISPVLDLTPQGIDLQSGDVMDAHITYDGSILTMVLTDTRTGAKALFNWPIDIPAVVGSNTAYAGFGGGTIPAVAQTITAWTWWQGMEPRLASPHFSVSGGSYASAQTVSISGPAGASIYYTTNGKPPTTASTLYSGPITVNSSQYLQAIAVESGYTDSLISTANYSIGSAGSPPVNFPNGFANAGGLFSTLGRATITGSNIQLTDSTQVSEIGAAWYVAPVNVQNFTTSFTVKFTNPSAYGMAFVIQTQNAPSTDTASPYVSGGPYNLGQPLSGLGYQGTLASVAVKFDLFTSPGNTTGLYTDGASPTTGETPITGIDLRNGDPINVTLTYDGTTLSMSMHDTVTGGSFSTQWQVNIPQIVGSDTAYIGFTGSTNFNQDTIPTISMLTFHN